MSVSDAGNGRSQDEAAGIIKKYGDAAMSYVIQLIEDAVRAGDDDHVDELDRLMREIERRLASRG